MKTSPCISSTEPLSVGSVDVVRLALALAGASRIEEVLNRSLEVLHASQPGMAWAILQRLEPGRYRAAAGPVVSYTDLRDLADRTCGPGHWLSLGAELSPEPSLSQPVHCAIRGNGSDSGLDPDVVLAQWSHLGDMAGPVSPDVQDAARLIAAAIASAAVFEYLLNQNSHDPLTSLLNRTGILESLERETARAHRNGAELSILFLDLDGFKSVNDRHGHAVGDGVLRHIAGLLQKSVRASDAVGRIGGDEFLVVLPDTGLNAARRVGRRLALAVETSGGRPMGLSFGAAGLDEVDSTNAMVELADRRMLAQKKRRQGQGMGGRRDHANRGVLV